MEPVSPRPPRRRHLHSAEALARAVASLRDPAVTGVHRRGNGVRVHALSFAAASLAALLLVMASIALARG